MTTDISESESAKRGLRPGAWEEVLQGLCDENLVAVIAVPFLLRVLRIFLLRTYYT